LSALQERKGILQKQLAESDILGMDLVGGLFGAGDVGGSGDGTQNIQVQMKKKELDSLLQRYSRKHPDVVRINKEIEALEAENKNPASTPPTNAQKVSNTNPLKQVLQTQITEIEAELQALRSQQERVRSQVGVLQGRVESTPARAIEISKINRNYEITLRKYQDLLAKSLDSELSENMEKKQKGEQFQILDPANYPFKALRPNRPMIILIGVLAGLGGGFGLAFLLENLDTSFKRGDEINSYVDVPLLATLPSVITRGSVLEQRRSQGLLALACLAVLVVGVVCLRTLGPIYF
jgi:polysaccharide chain length determinant protein (PEP-CTERM system associated)